MKRNITILSVLVLLLSLAFSGEASLDYWDATIEVGDAEWSDMALERVPGFEGPVARVTGLLKLKNVTFGGKPAGDCDLADWLEVLPGGGVRILDEGFFANRALVCLRKGETLKLKMTSPGGDVKWKSGDEAVVKVNAAGKVTARAPGMAIVTGKRGGETTRVTVLVVKPVKSLSFGEKTCELAVGMNYAPRLTVKPKKGDLRGIEYSSDNPDIAAVDASGVIAGVAPGSAVIKAKSYNGKSASLTVRVYIPAESIALPGSVELPAGTEKALACEISPANSGERIEWSSSDESVAKVTKGGVVKALNPGECVVAARASSGLFAECAVTVTRLSLNKSSVNLSAGRSFQLQATVAPKGGAVTWTSGNAAVATVDETGLVTAVSEGKAKITAACGEMTAECRVSVEYIKPESIIMGEYFVTLNPGRTHVISARVKPKKASDTALVYESSDERVATVSESGEVTALAEGRARITITARGNGKLRDSLEVCVIDADSPRMAGLVIGINPGHQEKTIFKKYPIAPGSKKTAYGCKTGATGKYTRVPEYETNLRIGLKLSELLTRAGAKVVMTRTRNDVSITNIDRAKLLNDAWVDIALQIHCNSSGYSSKNGICNYVKTTGKWADESRVMARCLLDSMTDATGAKKLDVYIHNEYMSLNWTTTPTVLLEMGYLSNRREDRLLASDAYRDKMALGILEGLADYFDRK